MTFAEHINDIYNVLAQSETVLRNLMGQDADDSLVMKEIDRVQEKQAKLLKIAETVEMPKEVQFGFTEN